jgi:hypothetical protein
MRWGLALGAAATLGAAAVIGTQWKGNPVVTPEAPAQAAPAPSREALARAAAEARGAEGQATVSSLASMDLAGVMGHMSLEAAGEKGTDTTQEIPADAQGPAGQRRISVKVRSEGSGSRITQTTEYTARESRGAARSNAHALFSVSLDFCPDKDGRVVATIEYQASGDTAVTNVAGTAGYSVNVKAKGRATGSVDDQAALTGIDQQLDYDVSERGGHNLQDGKVRKSGSGTIRIGADRFERGRSDDPAFTMSMAALTDIVISAAVRGIFDQAQAKWRGGACLKLVVRPPVQQDGKTNLTQPKERKSFEVAVFHRIEQVELPLPLDAAFDGRDTLEPKRVDRAPGRFDYVAGPDPKDYGNVALKSVSRRGIAQDRVAFSNDRRLEGSFTARSSGPMQTVAEGRVTWQGKPGVPDTYVPSGSVRVSGTRRKCKVEGAADLTESDGELHIKRDAEGRPTEYRGHGIKTMPLHFACPNYSATQDVPVAWFGTAEAFRRVAADGAIEGSLEQGIVNWTWRFRP